MGKYNSGHVLKQVTLYIIRYTLTGNLVFLTRLFFKCINKYLIIWRIGIWTILISANQQFILILGKAIIKYFSLMKSNNKSEEWRTRHKNFENLDFFYLPYFSLYLSWMGRYKKAEIILLIRSKNVLYSCIESKRVDVRKNRKNFRALVSPKGWGCKRRREWVSNV